MTREESPFTATLWKEGQSQAIKVTTEAEDALSSSK